MCDFTLHLLPILLPILLQQVAHTATFGGRLLPCRHVTWPGLPQAQLCGAVAASCAGWLLQEPPSTPGTDAAMFPSAPALPGNACRSILNACGSTQETKADVDDSGGGHQEPH